MLRAWQELRHQHQRETGGSTPWMQPAQPLGFAQGFGVQRINHSGADVMCGRWLATYTQYVSCCVVSVYAMSCIGDGLSNERAF